MEYKSKTELITDFERKKIEIEQYSEDPIEQIDYLLKNKIICLSNYSNSKKKIMSLYHKELGKYNCIPNIDDIEDRVSEYNDDVYQEVAYVKIMTDPGLHDKLRGLSPEQYDNAVLDLVSEVSDMYAERTSRLGISFELADIREILEDEEVAFYISYNDPIYDMCPYIVECMSEIIENDCQQTLLKEFFWDYFSNAYFFNEYESEKSKPKNLIVVKSSSEQIKSIDKLELFSR